MFYFQFFNQKKIVEKNLNDFLFRALTHLQKRLYLPIKLYPVRNKKFLKNFQFVFIVSNFTRR